MKITDVKTFIVGGNVLNEFEIKSDGRNFLFIKIETDEGFHGWGESGLVSRELAVQGAIRHFREFLIGRDPRQIGSLWQRMYRSQYFEGGRVLSAAISAIDIALHDIVARKLNVPVYQLLGGRHRDWVPCFTTTHAEMGTLAIEEAKNMVAQGWPCIRFVFGDPEVGSGSKIFEPRSSIALTAEWLIKIRESIGNATVLGIEYHHRLSVAEAASFCQKLPSGTLDFIEEPIRDETPNAYQTLRSLTNIPFAIGEEFSSKWQFMPFIEQGIVNFARIDICNVGGFTEAMKISGWCEAHYIDMMPHNPLGPISTAANLHFAAAVSNYAWLEERTNDYSFSSDIFPVQPKLRGTHYEIPTASGLGVEFNEAIVSDHIDLWEPPHLSKMDGSYTNN